MDPIVHCPACRKGLQAPAELAGQVVQCPDCRRQFVVPAATGVSAAPAPGPPAAPAPEPAPVPAPRPWDDADADDGAYDEDGLPRHRSIRAHYAPGRGGMVLTFGIVALVSVILGVMMCGIPALLTLVFGPLAWVLGSREITAIREGHNDPTGEGMTQTGRALGIVSTLLALALLALIGLYFGFIIFMVAAAGG